MQLRRHQLNGFYRCKINTYSVIISIFLKKIASCAINESVSFGLLGFGWRKKLLRRFSVICPLAFDKYNSGFLRLFHTMPRNRKERNR
jgi:hypothetical protein